MKRFFYTIFVLAFMNSAYAVDLLENFDLRSYSPVKNGLKDFTCQIRVKGLTDQVKKDLVNVKINDEIYYKLYWVYPGKIDITV
ncbi:unnamed protein product, partial [Chrysoparadoxa australica]